MKFLIVVIFAFLSSPVVWACGEVTDNTVKELPGEAPPPSQPAKAGSGDKTAADSAQ